MDTVRTDEWIAPGRRGRTEDKKIPDDAMM
jgi:hypothetical protein